MMTPTKTIRARYTGGIIQPLEAVPWPDGSDLTITIEAASGKPAEEDAVGPFSDLAGSWVGLVDCDQLLANVYASRATPSDRPVVHFPE
jgi:predicted DNA-binding antitoxin AbrB/MazE fold protein